MVPKTYMQFHEPKSFFVDSWCSLPLPQNDKGLLKLDQENYTLEFSKQPNAKGPSIM
jgi:hypothetical protein